MGNDRPTDLKLIDQKYKVLRQIGSGSFSEVYLVLGPQTYVALKLLKKKHSPPLKPESASPFKEQFMFLKGLKHANLAKLIDYGFDKHLERHYFTTELIVGPNIFDASKDRSIDFILGLFAQAFSSLEYLHKHQIFHLDLKAENLLVTQAPEAQVKIIDFELSSFGPIVPHMGTPSYMAPEIIQGGKVDERTDLYSMGVLLYYCLTRHSPFRASGIQETMDNHLNISPPPPSQVNNKIPPALDSIVMKLMNKDSSMRYQKTEDVLQSLENHWPILKHSLASSSSSMKDRISELEQQVRTLSHQLSRVQKNAAPAEESSDIESLQSNLDIDSVNKYNPGRNWHDYEKVIIAKAFEYNHHKVKPTAAMLGLAVTTIYKKIKDLGLLNEKNPLYEAEFQYTEGKRLDSYLPEIFRAALLYSNNKPYTAISHLKVSQGYFYTVAKKYSIR